MKQLIMKRLSIWIVLFSCSTAYCQVYLMDTPLFAEAGQAVTIRAGADEPPAAIGLYWSSGQQDGKMALAKDARGNWSATMPAGTVQGDVMYYNFIAEYDQAPSITSSAYVLYICPTFIKLQPAAMALQQNVIIRKKWNHDDAFTLTADQDGPVSGPASIACDKDTIYVLDSEKQRILSFDHNGKRRASKPIDIPTRRANDLIIDPTDDSFVVISQLEDKIYRIKKDGKLKQTRTVAMRKNLPYPAKFSYTASDKTLLAQDLKQQNGLVGVMRQDRNIDVNARQVEKDPQVIFETRGNQLILGFNSNPKVFAVTFDRPVVCVEEALINSKGIVWVLYTLEGDYRKRRLARLDINRNLVQTAEIDVWFAFSATRHMALTQNGVVLLAGDMEEARIIKFDYKKGI